MTSLGGDHVGKLTGARIDGDGYHGADNNVPEWDVWLHHPEHLDRRITVRASDEAGAIARTTTRVFKDTLDPRWGVRRVVRAPSARDRELARAIPLLDECGCSASLTCSPHAAIAAALADARDRAVKIVARLENEWPADVSARCALRMAAEAILEDRA